MKLYQTRGLSLPKNSVVRLTDYPDMIIAVYHGHKATKQQHHTRLTSTERDSKGEVSLYIYADVELN